MSQPEQIQEKQSTGKTKLLPMESIAEALEIDPTSETGLRWKFRPRNHFNSDEGWRCFNSRDAGRIAGSRRDNGHGKQYYVVHMGDRFYKAHRIVYALAHGVDPGEMQIDHIDGSEQNNNPANLRLASNAENQRNRGKNRNNKSGLKGVHWDNIRQQWRAKIHLNGRDKHLGYFHDIADAAAAYDRAAQEHHGEFYRPS